jgi:large subunit ribosomal protein L29
MKAADLREKSVDDLRELQKSLAHDVFQNRIKNFTNRLDDTSSMHKTKRDFARVLTLLREHELGEVASVPVAVAAPSPVVEEKAPAAAEPIEAPAKKSKKKVEAKQP